jgi:hypothetical protein
MWVTQSETIILKYFPCRCQCKKQNVPEDSALRDNYLVLFARNFRFIRNKTREVYTFTLHSGKDLKLIHVNSGITETNTEGL